MPKLLHESAEPSGRGRSSFMFRHQTESGDYPCPMESIRSRKFLLHRNRAFTAPRFGGRSVILSKIEFNDPDHGKYFGKSVGSPAVSVISGTQSLPGGSTVVRRLRTSRPEEAAVRDQVRSESTSFGFRETELLHRPRAERPECLAGVDVRVRDVDVVAEFTVVKPPTIGLCAAAAAVVLLSQFSPENDGRFRDRNQAGFLRSVSSLSILGLVKRQAAAATSFCLDFETTVDRGAPLPVWQRTWQRPRASASDRRGEPCVLSRTHCCCRNRPIFAALSRRQYQNTVTWTDTRVSVSSPYRTLMGNPKSGREQTLLRS